MFWGLIMEPNKRYSQLVERSFHLSMASLDVTSANDQPVQVMMCYENRNYLLCTLKKGSIYQVPLDLNFQEGTKIAFTCNGFGHVHLTGYLTLDEDFGDFEEEDDEEEEEDEEVPQLVKPKRKAVESPQKATKKAKKEIADADEESSDDEFDMEEGSDSDDDDSKLMDEDDSDDSEDVEDEDESEDEPEPELEKPKQKQKQNQVGKKQDKQKMVNGKESNKDVNKQKKNKQEQQQQQNQQTPQQQNKRKTIEGGVQIEDIKVGAGAPAKPGKNVSVYYVGRLKNGKKFDETRQGEGFKFKLGNGDVIKGWDVGISGMKIGGKRRLTIPANMAYGQKGSPPVIPGNSTLIFEVELKNVH